MFLFQMKLASFTQSLARQIFSSDEEGRSQRAGSFEVMDLPLVKKRDSSFLESSFSGIRKFSREDIVDLKLGFFIKINGVKIWFQKSCFQEVLGKLDFFFRLQIKLSIYFYQNQKLNLSGLSKNYNIMLFLKSLNHFSYFYRNLLPSHPLKNSQKSSLNISKSSNLDSMGFLFKKPTKKSNILNFSLNSSIEPTKTSNLNISWLKSNTLKEIKEPHSKIRSFIDRDLISSFLRQLLVLVNRDFLPFMNKEQILEYYLITTKIFVKIKNLVHLRWGVFKEKVEEGLSQGVHISGNLKCVEKEISVKDIRVILLCLFERKVIQIFEDIVLTFSIDDKNQHFSVENFKKEITLDLPNSNPMKTSIANLNANNKKIPSQKQNILEEQEIKLREMKSGSSNSQKIIQFKEIEKLRKKMTKNSFSDSLGSYLSDENINKKLFSKASLMSQNPNNKTSIFKRLNSTVQNYLAVFKNDMPVNVSEEHRERLQVHW